MITRTTLFSAAFLALALPAAAAPRKPAPGKPAKAAPAKAADPAVISTGKEAILVDHLQPEQPTVVLFYQPARQEDLDLLELMQDRVKKDPRIALRLVALASTDLPIAKQYEVMATPVAFVYDRNKNLLGKGTRLDEVDPFMGKGLRTARIKWIDEDDPTAPEVYRMFGGGRRGVPEIMKTMSLQPGVMETIARLAGDYHFHDRYLPRRTKEMIASYVSSLNKCKY